MSTKILDIIRDVNDEETVITLVTHKGKFHADDVTSTALLRLLLEEQLKMKTKTVRTFTPEKDGYTDDTPNCIVYDIGLGQYDHHQIGEDAKHCEREDSDGVVRKYAATGLIWKEIGPGWIGEKYSKVFYETVLKYIDNQDNGNGYNPLSTVISFVNPDFTGATDEMFDNAFEYAVHLVIGFLRESIKHYKFLNSCTKYLRNIVEKTNPTSCLVTNEHVVGADDICKEFNIPFYVYPNQRGKDEWCFKTISVDNTMSNHILDIPEEVRDWEGVTFLHHSCFLGSAVSKERAIEICDKLYNDANNK